MKRLFQNNEDGSIMAFDADSIGKRYNPYGLFYKAENMHASDFDRTEQGWLLTEFSYYTDDTSEEAFEAFQERNKGSFSIDEDEDTLTITTQEALDSFLFFAYMQEYTDNELVDGGIFYDPHEDFEEVDIEELAEEYEEFQAAEVYSYWDGSNWKELVLVSEWYSAYTEVTDEYPAWEDVKSFAYQKGNTWHANYYYYRDEEKKGILVHNVSYWQGSLDTYSFLEEGTDEYYYFAMKYLEDLCRDVEGIEESLKAAIIDEYSPELRKGEKLFFDEYELAFSFRDEVYHFDFDEIARNIQGCAPYEDDSYWLNLDSAVEKAREAIQKRRDERLAELQDISNNFPVARIFVERQDSLDAGNCRAHTDSFIEKLQQSLGLQGDFALRADELLSLRNDNFTRRAVIQAYRNGHYIH